MQYPNAGSFDRVSLITGYYITFTRVAFAFDPRRSTRIFSFSQPYCFVRGETFFDFQKSATKPDRTDRIVMSATFRTHAHPASPIKFWQHRTRNAEETLRDAIRGDDRPRAVGFRASRYAHAYRRLVSLRTRAIHPDITRPARIRASRASRAPRVRVRNPVARAFGFPALRVPLPRGTRGPSRFRRPLVPGARPGRSRTSFPRSAPRGCRGSRKSRLPRHLFRRVSWMRSSACERSTTETRAARRASACLASARTRTASRRRSAARVGGVNRPISRGRRRGCARSSDGAP